MKILFIDDDKHILCSWRRCLSQYSSAVFFAECHSVDDALAAIGEHNPQILFLDHHLTDGGMEGFEIVPLLDDSIKIISTTSDLRAHAIYHSLGITTIAKNDVKKIKEIIATFSK